MPLELVGFSVKSEDKNNKIHWWIRYNLKERERDIKDKDNSGIWPKQLEACAAINCHKKEKIWGRKIKKIAFVNVKFDMSIR